jgi:hypothetical protein
MGLTLGKGLGKNDSKYYVEIIIKQTVYGPVIIVK